MTDIYLGETAEDTAHGTADLSGTVAFRAAYRLGAGLAAGTVAYRAVLNPRYLGGFLRTEYRFFKGKVDFQVDIGAFSGFPAGMCLPGKPSEKGIEDIADTAEFEVVETVLYVRYAVSAETVVIGAPVGT